MNRRRLLLSPYPVWLALFFALTCCTASAAPGDASQAVLGRWQGRMADPGNSVTVGLEFKKSEGDIQAFFFCEEWDLDSIPIGNATLKDNEIQTVLFTGTLAGNSESISGTLDFGPMGVPDLKLPLVLSKAGAVPSAAPAAASRLATARWTFPTGGEVWGSPSLSDGVLYIGSEDGFLYALDAKTGGLKWRFQAAKGVRSRPAAGGQLVCFLSDDGFLYAVERSSGKLRWKFDTHTALVPHSALGDSDSRWDYLQSSPTFDGNLVIVGSGNSNLYAVDVTNGHEKWHYTTGDCVRSSPVVRNGTVYFGSWDNSVYALDSQTGAEKWKFDTKGIVQATPAVLGNTLIIGSRYPYVFALDKATGVEKWRFNYFGSWVESSAAVTADTVYVGSSDYLHLFAIDLTNGKRKWAFKTSGYSWSSPAVEGDVVYIGTARASKRHPKDGGDVYAVDAKTGREVWRFQTDRQGPSFLKGVVSSPAVGNGLVYFGALDGKVYAVPTK